MPDERSDRLLPTLLQGWVVPPLPLIRSRVDAVVDSLASSIESGELGPGDSLSVTALAQRLDVAAATVRSALTVLDAKHLVEHRPNRASVVVRPSPSWFVAVAAECSGLSIAAADLGVVAATDAQVEAFSRRATEVAGLWSTGDQDQVVGAEGLWELLHLLAEFSRNPYLVDLHASKRTALVLGIRSLSRSRNPAMLRSAVDALAAAVSSRDRHEAVDIVRDLFIFVIDGVTEL